MQIHAADETARRNAETIVTLYDEMINQRQPVEAVRTYVRPDYIQHNPMIPDGNEALGQFFAQVQAAFSLSRVEVHNVIAVGDWVWAHVHFLNLTNDEPDDPGLNGVDIYRFDDAGMLAEHWDAVQPIEPGPAANDNGIFGVKGQP
ncbi:MAG: nuclear transport factor 2 family protein [Actinomycetota bacterium]